MSGMTVRDLAREVHAIAIDHGWWDEPRTFGDVIALCHSELSEALEAFRCSGRYADPNIAEEFADVVIRIADASEHFGIDLAAAISEKVEINRARPYRHGGKAL